MAKPIYIVSLPEKMNSAEAEEISGVLKAKLTDYHVLVVSGQPIEMIQHKVFFEKDMIEATFNDMVDLLKLKEEIKEVK